MLRKRDYFLYLALIIPFMMIIIAIVLRFYHVDLQPNYSYLYASSESNECEHLLTQEIYNTIHYNKKSFDLTCKNTFFYIYNFHTNTSTAVSLENAKKYSLLGPPEFPPKSPDGFHLATCFPEETNWWWDANIFITCLTKNHQQKKIVLKNMSSQERNSTLKFIGWIQAS